MHANVSQRCELNSNCCVCQPNVKQEEQEKNAKLEKRLEALENSRTVLQGVVRKTQGMMGHMQRELQWLASEKQKVVSAAQVELEAEREKFRNERAKVLLQQQEILAAAVAQPSRPTSSRTESRGSPRRRKTPTTTPGRKRQVVRKPSRLVPLLFGAAAAGATAVAAHSAIAGCLNACVSLSLIVLNSARSHQGDYIVNKTFGEAVYYILRRYHHRVQWRA